MDISVSGNVIILKGNIKSIQDYQEIKATIDEMIKTRKSILLHIVDSISIISSVIGYLNKIVLKDNIDLSITVGDEQLMELFEDLNLVSLFQVKKA